MAAGPAGREDAGGAAEHIHGQARVVSNSNQAGCPGDRAGLEEGVLSEGHTGLRNIGCVHAGCIHDLGVNVQAVDVAAQNLA